MTKSLLEICVEANKFFTEGDSTQGFQSPSTKRSLETSLEVLQAKLNAHEILTQEEITNLARKIHIEQIFENANHRTAVYMVYALNILNGQLPRCQPYLLFGASQFNDDLSKSPDNKENRILSVVNSRAFRNISPQLVEKLMKEKMNEVMQLSSVMAHIRDNLVSSPPNKERHKIRSAGTTNQVKNYRSVLSPIFPEEHRRDIDSPNSNSTPSSVVAESQSSPVKFSSTPPSDVFKVKAKHVREQTSDEKPSADADNSPPHPHK